MADDVSQDPQVEETQEEVVQDQSTDPPKPDELEEESTEVEEPEEPDRFQDEPETEEEPERPPSRRESLRIQRLIEKMKQQPQAEQYEPQGMDYREAIDADDEVISQLEADRQNVGRSAYSQGRTESQTDNWKIRLELDNTKVESKYPQLDKHSSKFDPAIADSINNEYLAWSGYDPSRDLVSNPGIRYAEFVEARMEQAERIASAGIEKSSRNIARQAASTGLRPDGSTAKGLDLNKQPEDMSDEELDAVISANLRKAR